MHHAIKEKKECLPMIVANINPPYRHSATEKTRSTQARLLVLILILALTATIIAVQQVTLTDWIAQGERLARDKIAPNNAPDPCRSFQIAKAQHLAGHGRIASEATFTNYAKRYGVNYTPGKEKAFFKAMSQVCP